MSLTYISSFLDYFYTKFFISFAKQLPPNPILLFKNLFPILWSIPTALLISIISPFTHSHSAYHYIWILRLYYLSSSLFVLKMHSIPILIIHLTILTSLVFFHVEPNEHTVQSRCLSLIHPLLLVDHLLTLGLAQLLLFFYLLKSCIAVPSAKNSGFDNTSKWYFEFKFNIFSTLYAVFTGTVDFSTLTLLSFLLLSYHHSHMLLYFVLLIRCMLNLRQILHLHLLLLLVSFCIKNTLFFL